MIHRLISTLVESTDIHMVDKSGDEFDLYACIALTVGTVRL